MPSIKIEDYSKVVDESSAFDGGGYASTKEYDSKGELRSLDGAAFTEVHAYQNPVDHYYLHGVRMNKD